MHLDLVVGVAIALVVSYVVCASLLAAGPLDMPRMARQAHKAPTPTSGGIGIALGFAAGLLALCLYSAHWRHEIMSTDAALLWGGAAFVYGFLLVGIVDDAHPLSARLKFVLFAALSIGLAECVGVVAAVPLGWGVSLELGFLLGLAGTTAWIFVMVNCVNFMDGANGLAMGSVAVGVITLGVIAYVEAAPTASGMAACAVAALAGFLIWNFPKGRLFAGDSGALFAGAVAAAISLLLIRRTGMSPVIAAIAFFPLLADALLTLAWRAQRGRSLLDGHSEHIYQIALRAGFTHAQVALIYWAAMAGCGIIAFAVARTCEPGGAWIVLALLVATALAVSTAIRAEARKRGIEWSP